MRLDLKVDHAPVSINVAMPVGLLVNELLTNAFKYAFGGGDGGIITVRCLHEGDKYRVVVADDGVGLPEDVTWPAQGKLGALVLQTLRENVKTDFHVESAPGKGMRATIASWIGLRLTNRTDALWPPPPSTRACPRGERAGRGGRARLLARRCRRGRGHAGARTRADDETHLDLRNANGQRNSAC